MRIEGDTIVFKSNPESYDKEKDGRKPNTVRILDYQEVLELEQAENELEKIKIISSYHEQESFTRALIGFHWCGNILGKSIYVFSWRHYESF